MKKIRLHQLMIKTVLLGLLFVLFMGMGAEAAWKTTKKGTRYKDSSGSYVTDWQKIGGKWYYFGENGYLKKGLITYGGSKYYLDKKTGVRASKKWVKVGKYYYYAASNGKLQKSKWIGKCYVLKNYHRASGWVTIGKYKYYFNKSNGNRYTGWKTIGKYRYYFNKKGQMQTNKWIKTGKSYYYVQANGRKAVNTWIGKYQVGKNGARTGKTRSTGVVKENGKYYYYNASYQKESGWKTVGSKKYYFSPSTKAAYIGKKDISGATYYFNADGTMAIGWVNIGSDTYYANATGQFVKNVTLTISGSKYEFDANGKCKNNDKGKQIVAYALKFKGKPYVYGGNNLNTGVDCSGFTQQVMKHFGITIPRTADEQMKAKDAYGSYKKSVAVTPNTANLKPGDLVFYGSKSYSGHVALYIGNGQVIHAANEELGIRIDKYNYNKPVAARRYW